MNIYWHILFDLKFGDVISIITLIVNVLLTIWIVSALQNRLANRRVLKDHVIQEIKEVRAEYKDFFNRLYLGKIKPKDITPWFKLMNIKIKDILEIANAKYGISQDSLTPYQIDIKKLVTEFPEFNENYKGNKVFSLGTESKNKLVTFQQKHSKLFNQLIILVNDME